MIQFKKMLCLHEILISLKIKQVKDCTDIMFVVPATTKRLKEESIGTLILAKKAQLAGYRVDIARYWDTNINPKSDYSAFCDNFINYLVSKHPKIISFYCRCEEYHICIDLSRRIKAMIPDIIICFGGPQAELVAKETIFRFRHVDYVCCSEGENTIISLLKYIIDGEKQCIVDGLTYINDSGEVVQNKFPEFLKDNYSRNFYYYDLIPKEILQNCESMPIDVGRGCPFSCTYCSTKTFWKRKFRFRNIQNTVDEIEYVQKRYGINRFDFMHDLFTANKNRIVEFCQEIGKRGLIIKWGCDSRIDTISFELIDLMVSMGMTRIFFGIESGSKRMQKLINKNLDLQKCEDVVNYCVQKGLEVTTSFIYGFPDETEEDLDDTIDYIIKFQNLGCTVLTNMCHIMNGTELFARYRNHLVLDKTTAYNLCIPAFNDLYDLISENKEMFANFCNFPSPLRGRMKYLDVFRYSIHFAKSHHYRYEELMSRKYASLVMYDHFCEANNMLFDVTVPVPNGDVTKIRKSLKNTAPHIYMQMIDNMLNI